MSKMVRNSIQRSTKGGHLRGPDRPRSDRAGTRALTTHVAVDTHLAVKELALQEHLTVDEAMHVAMALLLIDRKRDLPGSLMLKIKRHRLASYLPGIAALQLHND